MRDGRQGIVDGDPKNSVVKWTPLTGDFHAWLMGYKAAQEPGPENGDGRYMLPSGRWGARADAGCRLRGESHFKRVDAWFRAHGWTARHTLHEMRAITLRYARDTVFRALAAANNFAAELGGHGDSRVTVQHYVGTVDMPTITPPVLLRPVPSAPSPAPAITV